MLRCLATLIAAFALAAASFASSAAADEAAVKRTVETRLPGIKILSVVKTNYSGLYEIRTDDNELFYTDEKVAFIFTGAIRDAQNPQRNLTEERITQLTAMKWSEMPLANAFKMVRGNGKRQVAYFSDPKCPYCRQFERELMQLEDVTIHVFLLPILAADSAAQSRNVWCSADKAKAWNELMLNGVQPAAAPEKCAAPNEQNLAFGRKLRVNSVPTIVLTDGTRLPGVRQAAALSKLIDEAASKR
ncbi:MAG: DsbC family protein [Burkholderiales bacterium]